MADLKQALIWLAEGKKIRRSCFTPNVYLSANTGRLCDQEGRAAESDLIYECYDWELYEETKDIKIRGSGICSTHNCDIRGVEITSPLEDDADYIVWDKNGNRSFAYWDSEDKCFYSLQCDCRCALDIKSWKKLPEQDEKT